MLLYHLLYHLLGSDYYPSSELCAMTAPAAPPPNLRLILEQLPNGNFVAEIYTDGNRSRIPLNRGMEIWEIQDLFSRLRRSRKAEADRREACKAAEELTRHRKVWDTCSGAKGQGTSFANKTIGPRNSGASRLSMAGKVEKLATGPNNQHTADDLL